MARTRTTTLDLLPYLEDIGLQNAHERTEGEIVAQCPAHPQRIGSVDAHPSFGFNAAKNVGFCFSCSWRPDLRELVTQLTGRAPDSQLVLDAQEAALIRRITERKQSARPDFTLNEWTLGYQFVNVPERLLALRHLKRRAADFFGIRWDPDVRCWVNPIRSPKGVLWGWQQRQKGAVNTYPKGVTKSETLFGHHLMANEHDTVVLVESPLDTVRLWQCRLPAVASMGAGVSNAQVELLARHYDTIILALDDDPAGRAQVDRLTFMFRKRKKAPLVWRYDGSAKDVGDYQHDDDIIDAFRKTYRLGL